MTRIPPHNLEAERSVLGAALISRDARFEIFDKLSLQHFYNKAHGEIWKPCAVHWGLCLRNGSVRSDSVGIPLQQWGCAIGCGCK